MLLACQTIENKSRGRLIAAMNGWYAEMNAENPIAPAAAIVESKKAAAHVGHPTNNPKAPTTTPPNVAKFEELTLGDRQRLYDR